MGDIMPSQPRYSSLRTLSCITLVLILFTVSVGELLGQEVIVRTRPLTSRESTLPDYALPPGTQIANGTRSVGIGQPAYLEALVPAGTVVTDVRWTLTGVWDDEGDEITDDSTAELQESILGETVPSYDPGDKADFDIAGRKMLVPDIKGAYGVKVDVDIDNEGTPETLTTTMYVIGSIYLGKDFPLCLLCHPNKAGGRHKALRRDLTEQLVD